MLVEIAEIVAAAKQRESPVSTMTRIAPIRAERLEVAGEALAHFVVQRVPGLRRLRRSRAISAAGNSTEPRAKDRRTWKPDELIFRYAKYSFMIYRK
ncbi:hypothetical protein P4054_17730 [Pseudomonas aeruginosa]|nr:hypothetical protein [Pseudomonas aeruginosa]